MTVSVAQTFPSFVSVLEGPLRRRSVDTVQINVGKLCNQACLHCHVEAGPNRPEQMTARTAQRVVELLRQAADHVQAVDITGGAPELNPCFRMLVRESRALGMRVLDRCNLTVLLLDGQEDTASFLAEHGVDVVASLPCYSRENVEAQRGRGVFGQSIEALRRLNALGYGRPGSGLVLDLVYNPGGPFLPPPQDALEADYRLRLRTDFGVEFSSLYTLSNMPISRFRKSLERADALHTYMELLASSHNPRSVAGLMCASQISIGWDGHLYDCDFNQMLDMPAGCGARTIWDIADLGALVDGSVAVDNHCYGCTAGAGSSLWRRAHLSATFVGRTCRTPL